MKSVNTFSLSGRLTADAQMHDAKNGKVARFSVAHNFGKDMDPLYTDAVMFSKNGKKDVTIPEGLVKGAQVTVSGYMRPNNYKNAEGQVIRRVDYVVLTCTVEAE